jgi:glycosidase
VGEVFDSDPSLPAFFQGGRARFDGVDSGLNSVFDFPLQDAIARVFAGKAPLRELPKMLAHDYLYHDPANLVTFIGLHDTTRFLPEALRQAFTFLLTTRGIPMIYYGDKVAMTGGDDPDNRHDFPGGWKKDAANAFEASGRTRVQEDLYQAVRKLAHIRAATATLRQGALIDLLVDDNAYGFARVTADSRVVVVFNHAAGPAGLHVPRDRSGIPDGARLENLLETTPPAEARQGALEIELPAHSAAIFR